jgi:hypothetical protein
MTLPADVTIIICGPLNMDAQRQDYDSFNEFFSSLDSQYITGFFMDGMFWLFIIRLFCYIYICLLFVC